MTDMAGMGYGQGHAQAGMQGIYTQGSVHSGQQMYMMPGSSPTYGSHQAQATSPGWDYGFSMPPPTANSGHSAGQQSFQPGHYDNYGLAPTVVSLPAFPSPMDNHSAHLYPGMGQQQQQGQHQRPAPVSSPPQFAQHYRPPHSSGVSANREVSARTTSKAECQDECAEEECGADDRCGNEAKPPKPDQMVCGIDTRPFLPLGLTLTTLCGMFCVILVQVPMLARLYHISETSLYIATLPVYGITLLTLTYSALTDPGQLPKNYTPPVGAALIRDDDHSTDTEDNMPDKGLPRRTHKCWQYKRPIRRYDHYCRWLTNVIGLWNHREFLLMVIGLVLIGTCGSVMDVVLMLALWRTGNLWGSALFVILHLLYSIALSCLAGPILKIHVGLVSRNEMAQEWKNNRHYIVKKSKHGDNVNVSALSDDEYNLLFESFVYDPTKNSFDKKSPVKNCWMFWCTGRWRQDQLGDF